MQGEQAGRREPLHLLPRLRGHHGDERAGVEEGTHAAAGPS